MKKTKKGVTLVELIICCGIIVMVGGACTAVLLSGQSIFNTSAGSANAQLDTDVVQTYLTQLAPRATNIGQIDSDDTVPAEGNCIYFDGDTFVIKVGSEETTISSITDFKYEIAPAGAPESLSARAYLNYTMFLSDGSSFSSGFVLSNLAYSAVIDETVNPIGVFDFSQLVSARTYPLCISVPVGEDNAT